jgi:HEAT repeat protein
MKIPTHALLMLAAGLLLAGLSAGCGSGEKKETVDVQAQIKNLKSDNAETRQNACVELAKGGESAAPAVQALIPALKDTDPLVRRLAAYALGEIGPKAKEAIPALKELMNDPERDVLTATINAIRAIDAAAAGGIVPPPNVSN